MISKQEAEYRDYPKGMLQCSGCSMFRRRVKSDAGPSSFALGLDWDRCTLVRGDISSSGWCKHWEKK